MTNRKKMIRIPGMCAKFGGCSPSTIWRRVADGSIPAPAKIGGMTILVAAPTSPRRRPR